MGFFILSLGAMGLVPWLTLKDLKIPESIPPYTPEELRGRQVYIAEGCWHCHTLFVRPVANEPERYGPASTAEESLRDIPQLYGTRRVGPDLAREGGLRPDDWHMAHLYNPRHTTPWSVMPPLPWLFKREGEKVVPTEDAKALVAFLQGLGKAKRAEMAEREAAWANAFKPGASPMMTPELAARGDELFRRECTGCHGVAGDGNGAARPFLAPAPERLTQVKMSPVEAFRILSLGVAGSAMPHWRKYGDVDRWALASHVVSLHRDEPPPSGATPRSDTLVGRGRELFAAQCTVCHGPEGRGDGPAGVVLRPRPPDFTLFRLNVGYAFDVITHGYPGSAMLAFPGVPEQERWALAYFVNSLYKGQ